MKKIEIYTDGACSGNPGKGGYGVILKYKNNEKELSGYAEETTNNKMELTAVIKGLKALKEPCEIDIYTDSQYVKQGITEWIYNWQKNGWKTADKKAVKNAELWQELSELIKPHKISWHWVKGHSGDPMNERADTLATNEIKINQKT